MNGFIWRTVYGKTALGATLLLISACAITRPCREGGSVDWPYRFKGDQTCFQKETKDGKQVNHGEYRQYDQDKNIVLEGMFLNGKKHGVWVEKDAKGNPVLEKTFKKGVEIGSKIYQNHNPARITK